MAVIRAGRSYTKVPLRADDDYRKWNVHVCMMPNAYEVRYLIDMPNLSVELYTAIVSC